jgi:hypothetical protein
MLRYNFFQVPSIHFTKGDAMTNTLQTKWYDETVTQQYLGHNQLENAFSAINNLMKGFHNG